MATSTFTKLLKFDKGGRVNADHRKASFTLLNKCIEFVRKMGKN